MEPALHVGDSYPVYSASSFKVNEIVAFYPPKKFSEDEKTLWVHRLVGSPGDIIQMHTGKLKLNGQPYPHPLELKFSYTVNVSMTLNKRWLENFDQIMVNTDTYQFFATDEEVTSISENSAVKSIQSMIYEDNADIRDSYLVVPGRNRDNWGPVRIPKRGDRIKVTDQDLKLYALVLGKDEADLVPGQLYTIPLDCYFVLGDNRHNALDSRFLGFITREHMKGVMVVD